MGNNTNLYDNNGIFQVGNLRQELLNHIVTDMRKNDRGSVVARRVVMDHQYTMVVIGVQEDRLSSNKVGIELAIFPDDQDAKYTVNRTITFSKSGSAVRIWEQFCDEVSSGKAIYSRDLIGNIFIGKLFQTKAKHDNQMMTYEHVTVDKWIGKIDPDQVVLNGNAYSVKKPHKSVVKDLLDEDEDENDASSSEEEAAQTAESSTEKDTE